MASDVTAAEHLNQNDTKHIEKLSGNSQENKFNTGMTVYKRDTGMAFEVVRVSHANGIKHYNLLCSETGSRNYLSKFAVEQDYTDKDTKLEKFGIRMVKRLSKMCTK
tara:strand:- start:494 stop:814 length:321 start_codon:yes stop_codon:yes gene_type:complete